MTESLLERTEFPHEPDRESAFGSFFTQRGAPVDLTREKVLVMSDPAELILLERGSMDLFAAALVDGRPVGRWTPLCRLAAGAVLALGSPPGPRHTVIGRPVPGSAVSRLPLADVRELSRRRPRHASPDLDPDPSDVLEAGSEFVRGIDEALTALDRALRHSLPPREFTALEPAESTSVVKGQVVRSVAGVQWVDVLEGVVTAGDTGAAASYAAGDRVCLTELDFLTAGGPGRLRTRKTGVMLAAGELLAALVRHAFRFAYAIDRAVERRVDRERAALHAQDEQDASTGRRTQRSFNTLLVESSNQRTAAPVGHESRAHKTLAAVAARQGIALTAKNFGAAAADDRLEVERLAAANAVPTRSVRLVGRWWRKDSGPLIAYRRQGDGAVALLRRGNAYLVVDSEGRLPVTVDQSVAKGLKIEATMLYRPLPPSVTGLRGLLRFGMGGNRSDATRFLLLAVAVALVGLLVPVLTGTILGTWVLAAQRSLVIEGAVLVILSAFVVAALTIVQNTALLRLEGRLDVGMQAAVWAKLLALPIGFFTRFAAAELGTAALGISGIRETLSSVSTVAALGLVSGLLNLILLFFYSFSLGLIALAMVTFSAVVSLLLARRGVRSQRVLYRSEQKLSSRSYQFLSGLSTLRLAAAEGRAYARWSRVLAENLNASLSVRRSQAAVTVFNAGFSVICSLGIFALVGGPMRGVVGLAAFLSFFTAFNQVLSALMQFCGAAVAAMAVVPMFEGVLPILQAAPEVREGMALPGELDGSIEVRDVSFRYGGDGPQVLEGVSFDVAPGEFVALVGATGSGKSTILRLLLGFEEPVSGSILFDGQDLRRLDITAVRRQCGVVLQNGSLLAGDLATNIIAGSGYSVDDAWRAAELAGTADDIRSWPMGMHTALSEGGSTMSGGQRQRLMIARALISSPRMLFFDEATSALDNETQRIVIESTRRLNASRLVIAHRLSTVEHADRIVVLDQGRVVQVGTYRDLAADPDGVFNRLVRRQMLDEVVE